MKLTITVNIPKEKVKLLEMYNYNLTNLKIEKADN